MQSRRPTAMVDEDLVLKPLTEDECDTEQHRGGTSFSIDDGGLDSDTVVGGGGVVPRGDVRIFGGGGGGGGRMRLRIKSSYDDVEVEIPDEGSSARNTSVAQLKALVRTALSKLDAEEDGRNDRDRIEDRYLRLICKGKLLSPDESFLSEFKVAENDVVHAVLGAAVRSNAGGAAQPPRRGQQKNNHQQQLPQHPSGTFHHLMQQQQQQQQRRRRQRPNRGIGTVVGPGGRVTRGPIHRDLEEPTNSSDDEEGNDLERGRRRERRGFDRLRSAGLSRQEIVAIRAYFNRHVDRFVQQQLQLQQQQQQQQRSSSQTGNDGEQGATTPAANNPPSTLHLDEPDPTRRRLLVEEEWMANQGAASEFRLNLNQSTLSRFAALSANGMTITGTNTRGAASSVIPRVRPGSDRDFVWGFFLGFFVGVIGLVWVWMPTVPHKQKLGILMGICCQLLLDPSNVNNPEDDENFDGDATYDDYGN